MSNGKLFFSPKEIASILGVSASTISRRIKDGTIPTALFGGMRLIPASFIDDLGNQASNKPTQGMVGGVQP
jgi:excisionase family DNA binding protein